jgi:hypothetical protein
VLLGVCVFSRSWAIGDLSGGEYDGAHIRDVEEDVRFGLRGAVDCKNGSCETNDLHDVDRIDRTGEQEGLVASYAIGLAAVSALIAGIWRAGAGRAPLAARITLAGPCVAAFVLSALFTARLSRVTWIHLGWASLVAMMASLAGALALLVDKPRHKERVA